MIHAIHSQPKQQSWYIYFWCILQFIILNYLIFFAFASICFDHLMDSPPFYILIILYSLILLDIIFGYITVKRLHIKQLYQKQLQIFTISSEQNKQIPSSAYTYQRNYYEYVYPLSLKNLSQIKNSLIINQRLVPYWLFLNITILIILIISQVINNLTVSNWPLFLGLAALFRVIQLIKFNDIVKSLLEINRTLSMIGLIVKIFYVMLIFSHIFACIYYALDHYLIQIQYFGSLNQNPSLYYQGYTAAFTPIYILSQGWRYVYAMYYMVSLLSTDAYGDIIPHNPFQNLLVIFYLYMSTIFIAWILQQMIFVFRTNATQFYTLLRCVKSLSQFLKNRSIPYSQTTNYLVKKHYKNNLHQQVMIKLSKKLQQRLLITSTSLNKFPQKLLEYVYYSFSQQFYSQGYTILDNTQNYYLKNQLLIQNYERHNQLKIPQIITIIMNGKVQTSYSTHMFCKFQSQKNIFGLEQFIVGTNSINPHLLAVIKKQARVFTIEYKKLKWLVRGIILENLIHLETKQIDINRSTIFANKNQNQDKLSIAKINNQSSILIRQEIQQLKDQFILKNYSEYKCQSCQQIGHNALNCHYCHYSSTIFQIINKKVQLKRNLFQRKQNKNKKLLVLTNLKRQQILNLQNKYQSQIKYKRVLSFEEKMKYIKNQFYQNQSSIFQSKYDWPNYQQKYNIRKYFANLKM